MRVRHPRVLALGVLLLVGLPSMGCRHGLTLRRHGEWADLVRIDRLGEASIPLGLGVVQGPAGEIERAILQGLLDAYPEATEGYDVAEGEAVVDVQLTTDLRGDPLNFFIAWPGFVAFAPAWHGFRHYLIFEVDATFHLADRPPRRMRIEFGYRSNSTTFWQGFQTMGLGYASLLGGFYGVLAFLAAPFQIPFRDAVTPFFLSRATDDLPEIVEYLRWKLRREAERLASD